MLYDVNSGWWDYVINTPIEEKIEDNKREYAIIMKELREKYERQRKKKERGLA